MGTSQDENGNDIPDECEDCNGNGILDDLDIADGTSNDDNGNGVPDECECPLDFDADGEVGITDFLWVLGNWGPCPHCPELFCPDINGDCAIGIDEFLALLGSHWGIPCP